MMIIVYKPQSLFCNITFIPSICWGFLFSFKELQNKRNAFTVFKYEQQLLIPASQIRGFHAFLCGTLQLTKHHMKMKLSGMQQEVFSFIKFNTVTVIETGLIGA